MPDDIKTFEISYRQPVRPGWSQQAHMVIRARNCMEALKVFKKDHDFSFIYNVTEL